MQNRQLLSGWFLLTLKNETELRTLFEGVPSNVWQAFRGKRRRGAIVDAGSDEAASNFQ